MYVQEEFKVTKLSNVLESGLELFAEGFACECKRLVLNSSDFFTIIYTIS